MNIEKILQINRKVEVTIVDGQSDENQILAQSVIQEIYNDSFLIMVPMKDGHSFYLAKGDKVVISIVYGKARYSFKSIVLDKKEELGIKYVLLKKPDKLATFERRNFVRVKTLLSIKYAEIENEEEKSWESIEPSIGASAIDLSGAGVNLSINQSLPKNKLLILSIPIEMKEINVTMKLLGKVIRSEKKDDLYRVGVKFHNITEKQENLIIRYVYYILRKYIQIYRDEY